MSDSVKISSHTSTVDSDVLGSVYIIVMRKHIKYGYHFAVTSENLMSS